MDTRSKYTTAKSVLRFRSETKISGSGKEDDIVVEAVTGEELVTSVNTQVPHYFYMYSSVIENLNLWFPFTTFEFALLRALNVAPSQLHPNSWAFVKAYEIVSLGLGLEPRLGIFFYFYYVKSLSAGKLVSLSSQPNRGLFTLYASHVKSFRNTFFRIRCGPNLPDLMFDKDGCPLFPFYWTSKPCMIKGVDEDLLTPYESEVIAFLDSFSLFEIKELLGLETDYPSLVTYLRKPFFCLLVLFC
jgi:hypothetical protein